MPELDKTYSLEGQPHSAGGARFNTDMDPQEVRLLTEGLSPAERVEFWRTFEPSEQYPSPVNITRREVDDLAAVVAGAKPAAALFSAVWNRDKVNDFVGLAGDKAGRLRVSRATNKKYGRDSLIVGSEEDTHFIVALYEGYGGHMTAQEEASYHRAFGKALGYPDKAIDAYISQQVRERGSLRQWLSKVSIRHWL